MQGYDLREMLKYINPSNLDYSEWVQVGMALKQEGLTAYDWDVWSREDTRYKAGECFRKWDTFKNENGGAPVAGGTIVEMAKRFGFVPPHSAVDGGHELSWDSVIQKDDLVVVDAAWLDEKEVVEPSDASWRPVQDLITYLETLFQGTENVGYVTDVYENEDRLSPKKGNWDRTAGQLIEELRRCEGDIGRVIGDANKKAGAWIRFNPLDGNGVKNDNVTDYRYALVESDNLPIGKQNAILRELELPIAAMVYSGKKSVHAIVKIEAGDYAEYRKRVEYLYKICEKNGLKPDTQNKNPSRLSRMPGVMRDGHKQFLMGTNIGKSSWTEWKEWIEAVNDDLPDPKDLNDVWNNLPDLSPELIKGVLREGHKMLLAGPSKAGKSFALIELCIAIAEGRKWLGFECEQGRVLYVNLELDENSCFHRFHDVYKALGYAPNNISNIDIWNLRGKSVPMDKLAPKLIRRAEKKNYIAVIIDPIYKVITGDENSADQMAAFCNQFDKICTELKAATIYCHHHSKGAQGGKKSMDRASGSGVFARDPDALLDLTELELTDSIKKNEENKARIRGVEKALNKYHQGWQNEVGQDDRLSASAMQDYATGKLTYTQISDMMEYISEEVESRKSVTAWRIEGTLREFASFKPLNLWFDYPIHRDDEAGVLADIKLDDGNPWSKGKKPWGEKKSAKERNSEKLEAFKEAFEEAEEDGAADIDELADLLGVSEKTVRRRINNECKKFYFIEDGVVKKKKAEAKK